GSVTLDGERKILARHAGAVVTDADEAPAARLDHDLDGRGAGIERVLDELLHGCRRPLYHLAGGNAVDQDRVETAHRHGSIRITRGLMRQAEASAAPFSEIALGED